MSRYAQSMTDAYAQVKEVKGHDCIKEHPKMSHLEWLAQNKDAKDQDKDPVGSQHEEILNETLGLGNKWPGMEKMPKTDKKTGKYVTGKTKIERLPTKKRVGDKGGPALTGYEKKK